MVSPSTTTERAPLLGPTIPQECEGLRVRSHDASHHHVVDFDPAGDPDDPLRWPEPLKWAIVTLLAFMAFIVAFTCISLVPVAGHIVDDLGGDGDDPSAPVLLITIWELGEAAGPLLIAPLSELFGRRPLLNVCNMLFIAGTVLAALAPTRAAFTVARVLTGMAVPSNVLNPPIVGDMFPPERRGRALAAFMFATLLGGTLGPAFGGAVAEAALGWRAVLWTSVVLASACELVFLTCFRETYKVVILRRRAAVAVRLKGSGAGPVVVVVANTDGANEQKLPERSWAHLGASMMRPVTVLLGSGVLAVLSLFGSFVFAHFYIVSVTLPSILRDVYGLSPAAIGSAFLANGIGSLAGIAVCNLCLDRIYVRLSKASNGIGLPEHRLPLAIVGAFTLPPAVVLYGAVAEFRLPIIVLLFATAWIRFSLMLAFLPLMAYIVDAFGLYSASAISGVIVARCLAGAFLPLATVAIIEHVGYGLGFTMVAAVCLILALIPSAVFRYGARWR